MKAWGRHLARRGRWGQKVPTLEQRHDEVRLAVHRSKAAHGVPCREYLRAVGPLPRARPEHLASPQRRHGPLQHRRKVPLLLLLLLLIVRVRSAAAAASVAAVPA